MMLTYNNSSMIDKVVTFLNAINKIKSDVYCV